MSITMTARGTRPLTAAERKARQRRTGAATAEAIDAKLAEIFRRQCAFLSARLIHREITIGELAIMVAGEFPREEQDRVWARFGLKPDGDTRIFVPRS